MTSPVRFPGVPDYARSVLHVCWGNVEPEPALSGRQITRFDLASRAPVSTVASPFDFVLITPSTTVDPESLVAAMADAAARLGENGRLHLRLTASVPASVIAAKLEGLGLALYGPAIELADGVQLTAVHTGYDALAHGRALAAGGHLDWAYEVLEEIPREHMRDRSHQTEIYLEKQLILLTMALRAPASERAALFFKSQQQFFNVLNVSPNLHHAFLCQSECWRALGRADLARRLLRSIQATAPEAIVAERIAALGPARRVEVISGEPPEWDPVFRPRILIITHEHGDYGMDISYDGLCRVLGAEYLQEFPYKPLLHGGALPDGQPHPSTCNHPGQEKDPATLENELRAGFYDLIIFADRLKFTPREAVLRVIIADPDIPLFIMDTWDDCGNALPELLDYLGRDSVSGYFKREMLAGDFYDGRAVPMPFAYSDDRVPEALPSPRTEPVFWAGHRAFGLRGLYLEHLEKKRGLKFNAHYTQTEYTERLAASRIGLDFFGLGFDTVRYWELAAHGCMLLAERRPTLIPHNFVDGVSAVFFDDLPELEEKLTYYLGHPGEAEHIAAAGRALFMKHHTSSARARQLLGCIADLLRD